MNAIELHIVTGPGEHKPSGVWLCQTCKSVACNQASAEQCCKPHKCEVCGQEVATNYWTTCKSCRDAKDAQEEMDRFNKAEKIPADQYDGWVFCEGHGNNGFAETLKDMLEQCDDDGCDRPQYVWACKSKEFVKVSLDRVVEDILEEGFENFESDDLNGLDELKAAVTAFEQTNKMHVAYEPDYKRAILIPEKPQEPDEDDQ